MEVNGSDGIPLEGREEEYATQLWLEGPSAFWLHPEGPLSETTPDEWREKQAQIKKVRAEQANSYANASRFTNSDYVNFIRQMQANDAAAYRRRMAGSGLLGPLGIGGLGLFG